MGDNTERHRQVRRGSARSLVLHEADIDCMSIDGKTVESRVICHYLTSGDYKGLLLSRLASDLGADPKSLLEIVVRLVKAGRVSLPAPFQTNPHVKLFDSPVEKQLLWFDDQETRPICLYPTAASVAEAVDLNTYDDTPFTKLMVLAYPKGDPFAFRISVLDSYQDDPRYEFRFNGFSGWIRTLDQSVDQLEESDRLNLNFGLGYDERGDRVVVVPLYRLDMLPGRQQRIWKENLAESLIGASRDYVTAAILGQWVEAVSVYDAIVLEQVEINKLFELMGRRPLFRTTFEETRPPQFSFFVKPTRKSYEDFVGLLDKMLSDNLSIAAFREDVERRDHKSRPKGSITMLEEWLDVRFPTAPCGARLAIIKPLREVRRLRQKPAHKIEQDTYDRKFYTLQDDLVWKVFEALRNLRCLLATDPSVSSYEPPYWARDFPVKSY